MLFQLFYSPNELTSPESRALHLRSAQEFSTAIKANAQTLVNNSGDEDWSIIIYMGKYHATPPHITAYGFIKTEITFNMPSPFISTLTEIWYINQRRMNDLG
ncbi:hypothetical protein GALMADRAFT_136297 [Galerina marginata CBS 339.88]|uniref:Uncharacterized protein n=1 Tax=Galerina marginata (strain CBS 339.88) TaxID=685588 RepID=A0A067TQL9_GALM3|nr:hypothetical protein GALMADRAFT_136297 [Galerina marginata CBS 339.88]